MRKLIRKQSRYLEKKRERERVNHSPSMKYHKIIKIIKFEDLTEIFSHI
jgi:hypothetical protein